MKLKQSKKLIILPKKKEKNKKRDKIHIQRLMILNVPEIFQNWTSTQFSQVCYIKAWVLVRIH